MAQLRQSVVSRLAGYEDTNDAERQRVDPTMRVIVGGRAKTRLAASTSQMSRFETEVLTRPTKVEALIDLSGKCVAQVRQKKPFQRLILDMDRSVSPTHGDQPSTAYNGHFERTCDRPQFLFNQHGGLERVLLRNGNVHRDDDWRSILEPVVACYREETFPEFFRADGVFAYPQN